MSAVEALGRDEVVSALVAAATERGAVVIGPPGSGLSTVLRLTANLLRTGGTGEERDDERVRLVRFPDPRLDPTVLGADDGLLLIVDDSHLGTQDQVLALRDRALVQPVVLGVRAGAEPADLVWLWRSGAIGMFPLAPLDDELIGTIVERCAGGPVHRATLDGIVHRSAGRPAFAVDEISSLVTDDRLVFQAGLLRGRLTGQIGTFLIDRARELLADLPAGLPGMIETIAMAGLLPHDALAPLGIDLPELRRRGLADRTEPLDSAPVRLAPPALTSAVRATLAPARAVALARSVLNATTPAALAADDRARLLILTGEHVELDELAAAAWTALRADDRTEAVNLARQLGARGPDGVAIEADLLAELGARAEAADRYAALMLDPAAPAGLRARAAMEHSLVQMWDLAQPDAAVATAMALADAAQGTPYGPATRVHLAALTLYSGRPIDAAGIVATIDPAALDDTMRAGRALVETVSSALCDPGGATPEGSRWLIDRHDGGSFERGVSVASVELSLELVGHYLEAETVVAEARIGHATGDTPASSAWSALALARCELAIGRHGPARRAAVESAAEFADVNHPTGLRWASGAAMLACALSGDRAATSEAVEAFDRLEVGVPFLDADVWRARAWAAFVLGNSSVAAALLNDSIVRAADSGAVSLEAVALHDSFRLLRTPVGVRLAALARSSPAPAITLRARHVEAVSVGDPVALLAIAADFEQCGALLLAAEAAGDAARLASAKGLRATARTAAGQRTRLAESCGNPVTPGLAEHQPITLTIRERDVATLAAAGRTSREIAHEFDVSVRTVDNLLQRVYLKVGVHNRSELAARLSGSVPRP